MSLSYSNASLKVSELIGSRRYRKGSLFEQSTVSMRFSVQMLCVEGALQAFDPDAVKFKLIEAGFVLETGKPFGFPGYTHPVLGDKTALSGYSAARGETADIAEGWETSSIQITRDMSSASVYYLDVELAMVEKQFFNHAEISLLPQSRQSNGFRVNATRPTLTAAAGLVDDPLDDYTMLSDIGGRSVDFNTQPISLTLAGTQITMSCVVRAPYFLKATDTAFTVSPIYQFWTKGEGAAAVGARWKDSNSLRPNIAGYKDYEIVVQSVNLSRIVGTFHRLDIALRVDEWYSLEQIPFSVNGTVPATADRHSGGTAPDNFKITKAKAVAWLDPSPRAFEPDLSPTTTLPYNALFLWKSGLNP